MNNAAIILGAGNSTRMELGKSKLLIKIKGKTVLKRSVEAFFNLSFITEIIVVCRSCDEKDFRADLSEYGSINFVHGGATRQDSVDNALQALSKKTQYVIIHDGARPLISQKAIVQTYNIAIENGAAAVGVPIKDTVKMIDAQHNIIETPDRDLLYAIQTPQIFSFSKYLLALKRAKDDEMNFTDDCQLFEYSNENVKVVKGDYDNIKITTPDDVAIAEKILEQRGE